MLIFFGWIIFALAIGVYASGKNVPYGFFGGFLISLVFSPIIGFVVIAFSKPSEKRLLRQGFKKCPACFELVRQEARKCKHCGEDLSAADKK